MDSTQTKCPTIIKLRVWFLLLTLKAYSWVKFSNWLLPFLKRIARKTMKTRKVRTLTSREFPPWWLVSSADSSMTPWGDVSSEWQRTTTRDDESAPSAGHQGPRSPGRRRLEHRPWWTPGVLRPLRQAARRGSRPSPGATLSVRPPPATLLDMQVFLLSLSHG